MSLIPGIRRFTSLKQFENLITHLNREKKIIEHQRNRLKATLEKINTERTDYYDEMAKVLEQIDAYEVLISSLPVSEHEKYQSDMEQLQFRRTSLKHHLNRVSVIMEMETIVNLAAKEREFTLFKSYLRNVEREKKAWIQKQ